MNFNGKILLIPDKLDEERDAVANAWRESGGEVIRLARFWEPPLLNKKSVCLYGGNNFSLVVAQKLGLELISPADNWLLELDYKWLKRKIFTRTLTTIEAVSYPMFAKPSVPKIFRAGVYDSSHQLIEECKGLDSNTKLLFSEVVSFVAEARAFIANEQLLDCQLYEGIAETNEAEKFVQSLLAETTLPMTCVIDVGFIPEKGWAVVEANASWGSGLNGCDASRVLPAIALTTTIK